MIDAKKLDEWQAACDAATPGPWTSCKENKQCLIDAGVYSSGIRLATMLNPLGKRSAKSFDMDANGELIALSRTALPEAIAEICRLRADAESVAEYSAQMDALLEHARKVLGRRDVHSVFEALDTLARELAEYKALGISPDMLRRGYR